VAFCDRWALLGLAIGLAPVVVGLVATVLLARLPARLWLAHVIAPVGFVVVFAALRPATLILWNGLRPAVCN